MFLSVVPFVLCNLLAPDGGGGNGGGGTGAPPTDPPPTPPKPDEPQGATIEAKLTSAGGIIANYFQRIGELMSQLATSNGERTRLDEQFSAVSADLKKEKEAHVKTQGLLSTANTQITGLTTQRDNANKNVERLEKICNLRGIDPNQAVHVPPEEHAAANTGAAKWEAYNALKDQERKGEKPTGTAMAYWRENKKALDEFAASKRRAA